MKPYYDQDGITIYCGDCREILPELPTVNLVLTDPPYGVGASGKTFMNPKKRGSAATESRDYGHAKWDDSPADSETLVKLLAMSDWAIIWGGNYFSLPPSSCWLVWDKDNGSNGYADCELAWTNLKKAVRRLRYKWHGMIQEHAGANKEQRFHPTQKALAVMRWCINQAPADCETILDAYAGSGTTLLAAKLEGRKAIGIEIEERYCEVMVKRLRQKVLF